MKNQFNAGSRLEELNAQLTALENDLIATVGIEDFQRELNKPQNSALRKSLISSMKTKQDMSEEDMKEYRRVMLQIGRDNLRRAAKKMQML